MRVCMCVCACVCVCACAWSFCVLIGVFHHVFQDMIGQALPMITSYGELDNSQQVVALINEVCTVLKKVLHAVKQRIVHLKFDAVDHWPTPPPPTPAPLPPGKRSMEVAGWK